MPCRAVFRELIVLLALLIAVSDAAADKRIALVVGVDAYDHLPRLVKARGDAIGMKAALEGLSFEVMIVLDPDRRAFNAALADLRAKAKDADLVLFHFSGHGVALDGDNYLFARDAPEEGADKDALEDEGVSQTQLLNRLGATAATGRSSVMVIDACRNNPYAYRARSVGGERGLARVELPRGAFIFYSAGFGQTALDELGPGDPAPTSVYMRVLLDEMTKPGANLDDIANARAIGSRRL